MATEPNPARRKEPPESHNFVIREESERWCAEAIGAIAERRPHCSLVVGEPGAGKTRLLRELCARAVARGVDVHIGRGWEGTSVPFLPLRHALSSGLAKRPHSRGAPLDRDREILEWLVHGDGAEPARSGSDDAIDDSARLASSVARGLLELARGRPTLLVLDDLQWFDHPTLDTFELVAFALADAVSTSDPLPFLLVGSLRPPEAEQRAARVLARLKRESACRVLELSGFNEDEMNELLVSLGVGPATHQLLAMVHEATGGNPLFAEEVVRRLQRIGAIERRGRFYSMVPAAIEVPLPADVRSAITSRTVDLDTQSRELVTLGAVLGDPFDLATLAAIAGVERTTLADRLDEWIAASVVVTDGARAHFSHPLIRQGLLAELTIARRQRLHADVVAGLGRLSPRPDDDRRLEIAHHLVSAGPAVEPKRIVTDCVRAGQIAGTRHAWTDAARFYEAALAAAARVPELLSRRKRADLHYRAGFAHYRDQDAGACVAEFEAAVAQSRAARDWPGVVRALLGLIRARFTLVSVSYGERIETFDLDEVVQRIADDEPILAGFAWSEMAQVLWTAKKTADARVFAERALAVGETRESGMLAAEAHRALSLISAQELRSRAALEHLEAGLVWARRGGESWIESQILQRMMLPLLWLGKADRVESIAETAAASTRLIHDWGDHSLAEGGLVCWAVARGEFDRAEKHAAEVLRLIRRSRYPWAGPTALPAIALARALRGAWTEAEEALSLLAEPQGVFDEPGLDIVAMSFLLGQVLAAWRSPDERDAVAANLELLVPQLVDGARGDAPAMGLFSAALECADVCAAPALATAAYDALLEAHENGIVMTTGWVSLVTRVLGTGAALLERWDDAEAWFEKALSTSRSMGLTAEHVRTIVARATMLERRGRSGDDQAALELIALAVPQLRELGMTPLLANATGLARRLSGAGEHDRGHAGTPDAREPRLAIVFTDIEGSTAAYDRLGDAAGRELVRAHDAIVREWLARSDGTWLKHTGDGILAAFPSVASSLDCAISMQRAFARHTDRHPHRPLLVRIGIHVGEPLAEDGDLFGTAVNTAARVCAEAKGGEILVTDEVVALAERPDVHFRERGRVALRGLRSAVALFELVG